MAPTAAVILSCAILSQAFSLQNPIHSSDVVPKKFFVEPSNLINIAASSTSMVARIGTGAFVDGYSVKIVKETEENANKYAVLDGEVLKGYRVEETTTSVFDRRPAQLIELYEFWIWMYFFTHVLKEAQYTARWSKRWAVKHNFLT
jgi:hypothetical protein